MERRNDRVSRELDDSRFHIAFVDAPERLDYYVGEIGWPGFRENFHASKSYWSRSDYVAQWQQAVQRALNGAEKSCFIVSMENPANANFIRAWVMYRISRSELSMQEHIIFLKDLSKPFDISAPWNAIGDRETVDESGQKISEWAFPVRYISDWLK